MEAVIEIRKNLNAQQDVMDILQEAVYLLGGERVVPPNSNLNRITKDDWTYCWGKPCEWYVQGCVICDRWKLWTKLTGETIEYEAHEEDCECNECPTGTPPTDPRDRLLQLIEDGVVDPTNAVAMCVKWMSTDDVTAMLDANELSERFFEEEKS